MGGPLDTLSLLVLGKQRILKTSPVEGSRPLHVRITHLKDEDFDEDDKYLMATAMQVMYSMKELIRMQPLHRVGVAGVASQVSEHESDRANSALDAWWQRWQAQLQQFSQNMAKDLKDPSLLADLAAALCVDTRKQQELLGTLNVQERLNIALEMIKKELEIAKLQQEIQMKVEKKLTEDQRRYHLKEQLKSIKKELGIENDGKSVLIEKFRDRIDGFEGKCLPDNLKVVCARASGGLLCRSGLPM
eukprot:scaffold1034_cov418-Prasinococcus_capsulatus_cf.AAC.30